MGFLTSSRTLKIEENKATSSTKSSAATSISTPFAGTGTKTLMTFESLNVQKTGVIVLLLSYFPHFVHCKGGGIAGAAAGGGASAGADWTLGGNYTTNEITVALIVLAVVLFLSLLICSCQCYQKVMSELENEKWVLGNVKRSLPPAPYNRDSSMA